VTRSVSLRAPAIADVAEAHAWYEEQRPGLGEAFVAQVDAVLESVASQPEAHAVVEEGMRRALLRRFPYAVFYVVEGDDVDFRAVLSCTLAVGPGAVEAATPPSIGSTSHAAQADLARGRGRPRTQSWPTSHAAQADLARGRGRPRTQSWPTSRAVLADLARGPGRPRTRPRPTSPWPGEQAGAGRPHGRGLRGVAGLAPLDGALAPRGRSAALSLVARAPRSGP
jgi:hypothetical protein